MASQDDINGINITPLVDVSLVLVLIFMVTMPLSMIHGIDVKRQVLKRYGLTTPQENVVVHLTVRSVLIKDKNGGYKPVAAADVAAVLGGMMERSSAKRLLLECDRDVAHGQTVGLMDIAKQNGAADISLLAKE